MNFYLAGRYDRRLELLGYAGDLMQAEHHVTSRWLNGAHEIPATGITDDESLRMAQGFAEDDIDDLLQSDAVVSFTEKPNSGSTRGGRHVEYGIALATRKRCIVVGPRENVFHVLPQVERYETWADAKEVLCQ